MDGLPWSSVGPLAASSMIDRSRVVRSRTRLDSNGIVTGDAGGAQRPASSR
jgi:hypothetical protein